VSQPIQYSRVHGAKQYNTAEFKEPTNKIQPCSCSNQYSRVQLFLFDWTQSMLACSNVQLQYAIIHWKKFAWQLCILIASTVIVLTYICYQKYTTVPFNCKFSKTRLTYRSGSVLILLSTKSPILISVSVVSMRPPQNSVWSDEDLSGNILLYTARNLW